MASILGIIKNHKKRTRRCKKHTVGHTNRIEEMRKKVEKKPANLEA